MEAEAVDDDDVVEEVFGVIQTGVLKKRKLMQQANRANCTFNSELVRRKGRSIRLTDSSDSCRFGAPFVDLFCFPVRSRLKERERKRVCGQIEKRVD
jgi:hypothetical protein